MNVGMSTRVGVDMGMGVNMGVGVDMGVGVGVWIANLNEWHSLGVFDSWIIGKMYASTAGSELR